MQKHAVRKVSFVFLPMTILLFFPACDNGNGGDGDADVDADVEPEVMPDPQAEDADRDMEDAPEDVAADDGTEVTVTWEECPLYADERNLQKAECALVELPLRADEPEGPGIEIWVQRLPATASPKRGQIWFLRGGPGSSGAGYDSTMHSFWSIDPRWDFYTLDSRGVGKSGRLGCPDQEDPASFGGYWITEEEWDGCIRHLQDTWGSDLDEFTTTNASRDLGALIELMREPGLDVIVYGCSYGSYWAIRYLQLFPDQPTAVILDSILAPGITFATFDVNCNDVGEDFMEHCAADTLCTEKLGSDPWAVTGQVMSNLEAGSCPAFSDLVGPGTERFYLRHILGSFIREWDLRPFIPAVIYRLNRCEPGDGEALAHLLGVLFGEYEPSVYDRLYSDSLHYNVGLSELWPDPHPDAAEIAEILETLYVSVDGALAFTALQDLWPAYPRDEYVNAWPTTSVPMLMMNGDLDPQTPIWITGQAADHFNQAGQYFVTFPRCPHNILDRSPTSSALTCGSEMFLDFIDDPHRAPDNACLAEILPIDFTGDPGLSMNLLGTADMWENPVTPFPAADEAPVLPVKPPGLDRIRQERKRLPPPRFLVR